ncbi:AI-2E family transporter [Candidatus Nanohalobium constans]|uniref:Putative permease n=1 Tax=Candidatus Nanohalobium constans TaxID=2565781 RepID=A0A5Q0UJP5_9ARCH|nr:AI-2E family transporter [Candidatus Nanohalobium constans]QGA81039.1 putative permease [Candidatus Nanohalobium constans]
MNSQRGFVLVLTAVFLLMAGLMLKPFVGYLLGSLVLAFVLHPAQKYLRRFIDERISAFFLTILSVLVFLLPFAIIVSTVAGDASGVINDVTQNEVVDIDQLEALMAEYTDEDIDIRTQLRDAVNSFVSTALGGFSQILGILTAVSIGVSIMLFVIFYLLKDGEEFADYLKDLMPLPEDIADSLYAKTYSTTWAVIKGHVLVALAQGAIAGIGLWVAGVPNFVFWTFVMIMLSFIPLIGSFLVWGPAGIYLVALGEVHAGIFLLIYGVVIVNLTDNFLRPFVVDESADLHPAVILIGVIGGVYVFGASGLFIGPVVFGTLKAVLEVFNKHYQEL